MTKEEMQNSYIEMLIQDLEKHSFDYWESTQDEMVGALRNLQQENKQLKDKLSKIETLIINHNCDTGDIYYKYNSKFLKSELKQRILEIVYEEGSDNNE